MTLQGFGFPSSPFQTLSVSLLGTLDRICIVQSFNATTLQCMISLSVDPSLASEAADTFEIQLTANEEPARCMDTVGCKVSLQLPEKLKVLEMEASIVPYKGRVTILLEDVFLVTGKNTVLLLADLTLLARA